MKKYFPKLIKTRTSVSDRKDYREICEATYENKKIFKNFKRKPAYQNVLEHLTRKQGQAYLDIIKK